MHSGGASVQGRIEGHRRRIGGFARCALVASLLMGLSACSSWFSEDTPEPETVSSPSGEESYPNLASVPDRPPRPTPEEIRDSLTEGLRADRANARYSGQALTGVNTAAPAATPPPPTRRTELPPEPPPAPAQPAPAQTLSEVAVVETATDGGETLEAAVVETAVVEQPSVSPQQAGAALSEAGTLVGVIYFLEGSSNLDSRDRGVLDEVVALQRAEGGQIRVVGHESPSSAASGAGDVDGLQISLDRANAVAEMLTDLGAPQEKLDVIAAGASAPRYDESEETGVAGNRRVEIFIE